MENKFELILINRQRSNMWWSLLPFSYFFFFFLLVKLARIFSYDINTLTIFLLEAPLLFAVFLFLRNLYAAPSTIIIQADRLLIHYKKTDFYCKFLFADIVNYDIIGGKGTFSLVLLSKDHNVDVLSAERRTSLFFDMVTQFEEAYYRYKYGHDRPPPTYLGPAFLRRRIAAVLLVGAAIVLIALTLFLPDDGDTRLVVLSVGYIAFIFYCVFWGSANSAEPRKH